jgi:hypothetical protein
MTDCIRWGLFGMVLITHEAMEADIQKALSEIGREPFIAGPTQLIRIETD